MQNLKYVTNEHIYKTETASIGHREEPCGCQEGEGMGGGGLGVWDWQMQTVTFRKDKQQGPNVQHRKPGIHIL